jgi:pyrimidine-specific ribonucleoside hydrolase
MVGPRGSISTCTDTLLNAELVAVAHEPQAALSNQSAPKALRRWHKNHEANVEQRAGQDLDRCSKKEAKPEPHAQPTESHTSAEKSNTSDRMPFVFDMETGDPDDVLTLVFLGAHPFVDLRAVTITPGTQEQVALVRWLLHELGLPHVRIGADRWPENAKKNGSMNGIFYKTFGRMSAGECERADIVLAECCDETVTLVTGAPLHNLGAALKVDGFRLGRWVAQGGFAGDGVVPRELQMDKFIGKKFCPTWNFGGNNEAATLALASPCIGRRILVSKNVCHSVVYDDQWHNALAAAITQAGEESSTGRAHALRLMYEAMDDYLRRKPSGKKLHDPLALAVAFDESVCKLAEVKVYHTREGWGAEPCPESGVWISVDYDAVKFQAALLNPSPPLRWPLPSWSVGPCRSNPEVGCHMVAESTAEPSSSTSSLSSTEKLVLRLASKLRDICKLERRIAAGEPVAKNQLAKIATRDENAAAFQDVVMSLPAGSSIKAQVEDVLQALTAPSGSVGAESSSS